MIEKAEVNRLKRRHENVYNEIYMEKRALTKLRHPNVVRMHSTFQDYGKAADKTIFIYEVCILRISTNPVALSASVFARVRLRQ